MIANVVSVSGGKDSTALLLLAIGRGADPIAVFADTGNEHEATYEYLDYLRGALNIEIRTVRADFARLMAGKRAFIAEKWADMGVNPVRIERALELLHPTGNPFLDMCMWKGRFPSTKARFCTDELKIQPITNDVVLPLLMQGREVWSWQGVRADESRHRATLEETEYTDPGITVYRPILSWTAAQVFDYAASKGIKPNPLYMQGMGRVGCMPCINCRKDELLEISKRFPEHIERIMEWERLVSDCSKLGSSTFFVSRQEGATHETHGIGTFVEWSKTSRGGSNLDIFRSQEDVPMCASNYGLCE